MKKIMFLGGGGRMLYPLLEAAKNEGYYVILCGNILHENAVNLVDKHYNVDCTDKKIILDIAREEKIDGVLGNAEYAMQYVSYIAENLGLIGNSCRSVEILNEKSKFRQLQKKLNLFYPKAIVTESFEEALSNVASISFPVFLKCDKGSSSKGACKIENFDEMKSAREKWEICKTFSTDSKVVLEEYVDYKDYESVIDGDIFVYKDKIFWNGLFTSKRDSRAPYVPMTQIYPVIISNQEMQMLKEILTKIIRAADITFGELNVELYYTKKNDLFCIEINARQGGNFIPLMIKKHSGIDFYRLLVTTAVGEDYYFNKVSNMTPDCKYVAHHPVFSYKDGIYAGLYIDDKIKPYVDEVVEVAAKGAYIKACSNATDVVAFVFLTFQSREEQLQYIKNINELIYTK